MSDEKVEREYLKQLLEEEIDHLNDHIRLTIFWQATFQMFYPNWVKKPWQT